ncbi:MULTISPECIES: PAS domain-containing sensor histidine kinase [unclassified Rhizobium]|uniref:PAS domain-containing sensor histidine kinase n=1 Tax=unclassified Rhizobium TaxID=2613769 RepID=UPI001AD9CDF8|nr:MULTISPECIES: ATP-binding protein [unclassified Rhizobium]MBO9127975.1 PAS domain-containing protein [Rhizobium sp. 16-488-2b]MBO9178552.1 PAS domain-containing protein [Rhizobium sp. 16-488-2a]
MTERVRRVSFLILAVVLAAVVFFIDSIADYESSVAILYLAVLALVSAVGNAKEVTRAAQACVILTVLGWLVVHLGDPKFTSILRCLFACIAIGVTAALLVSRKRLEATQQDLERSRAEVDLFANSVPYVLWRSNPRGEIEYLNASWTVVTGLDRVTVLQGQRYNDVVHPDDIPILNETVSAAVANRTVTNLKVRIRQADGAYRWMQIYDNPAYSPLTDQVERFGGLSDVHDEVVAKQELQVVRDQLEISRTELMNFTDSVPQILWRADAMGKIDFVNRRYTEITARDVQTAVGLENWLDDIHPDDRERFDDVWKDAILNRNEVRATYRLRHASGEYRWMSLVGRPVQLSESSDETRYYGGISDIHDEVISHQKVKELNETLEQRVAERTSELLRTEQRYIGLFDVSNMTFAEMDFSDAEKMLDAIKASGVTDLRAYMAAHPDELASTIGAIRTTRVNEALARMMGYESVAELVANPPAQNAEDGAEVLFRQLEMYFYGVDHIDGRTVLAGKEGRRIPVYFTVTRLSDGLHLSSHLDLSEQERIEQMRQAAQAEMARANRIATVGAFSASIAHELNQPITSMVFDARTGIRMIARENPDMEGVDRILQRMEKNARRVSGIVQRTRENLVGKRRPVEPINLKRLVMETRDLIDHDLKTAHVELEVVSVRSLPEIMGDPVELQQVFVNLVNNAVDAMRGQHGVRRVSIELVAKDSSVEVRVTDTGPGIPEEYIQKLFEPFFTTKATGIGMGLEICRSAVAAMGGQLTVANLPEGGARFSFELPFAIGRPI